jgi:hypothetical protein
MLRWMVLGTTALMISQAATARLNPEWGVVFPSDDGQTILRQCSRIMPDAVEGAWVPAPAVILDVEVALAPALQAALDKAAGVPPRASASASDYYRQYVGIVVKGKRVVYINGFHQMLLTLGAKTRPPRPGPDWRNQAVNICDGFTLAFGAEFDTGTRTIQNFHFNSPGVAPVADKPL